MIAGNITVNWMATGSQMSVILPQVVTCLPYDGTYEITA